MTGGWKTPPRTQSRLRRRLQPARRAAPCENTGTRGQHYDAKVLEIIILFLVSSSPSSGVLTGAGGSSDVTFRGDGRRDMLWSTVKRIAPSSLGKYTHSGEHLPCYLGVLELVSREV